MEQQQQKSKYQAQADPRHGRRMVHLFQNKQCQTLCNVTKTRNVEIVHFNVLETQKEVAEEHWLSNKTVKKIPLHTLKFLIQPRIGKELSNVQNTN